MKLYLSSYRIGDQPDKLRELAAGRTLGFIPNALDHVDPARRRESNAASMNEVREVGVAVATLDLTDHFGDADGLAQRIAALGGVWVRGGNTFVLRQAMRLSGFDDILVGMDRPDFLYAGYSAGVCVLGPTLDALQQVDDPTVTPYPESDEVLRQGLGILDYVVLPHYKSDHHESELIDLEVEYCRRNGVPFKTLRDGEVIVVE